ncbi:MAG: FAD:protein FMN transferase [Planctomycetota bacterium]
MAKRPHSNRREFLLGRPASSAVDSKANPTEARQRHFDQTTGNAKPTNYLESYAKNAMACEFEFTFNLHQYSQASSATMSAFQLLDQLESQMTVYRDQSEISQLNRTAVGQPVSLESRLYELLKRGLAIHESTAGAFDMTAGHLSRIWGFDRRKGQVPEPEALRQALDVVGSAMLKFDDETHSISIEQPGVEINLGGIGKGYALDRISELFRREGISDFLLHGGQSSLLAVGSSEIRPASPNVPAPETDEASVDSDTPDDKETNVNESQRDDSNHAGWIVGITHPNLPNARLAELTLRNRSLGTSGTAKQGFFHRGKRYGHIIDPRTGWPASHFLSTTVVAPTAAQADALATAFFVMSLEEIESFCADHPDVSAILISEIGRTQSQVNVTTLNVNQEDWRLCHE